MKVYTLYFPHFQKQKKTGKKYPLSTAAVVNAMAGAEGLSTVCVSVSQKIKSVDRGFFSPTSLMH